jgi:hypothetical protein
MDGKSAIASLIEKIEAHKAQLGVEYYSVGGATLERVFMNVVKENNIVGEDERPKKNWWKFKR